MKKVSPKDDWPESWKSSYQYDLLEIYGGTTNRGYAHAYASRRKHILELVQKVALRGAKILDVAAAQGNFTLSLAELGYEVTWNDLREELADYVRPKYECGLIRYAPGNIFTLGFDSYFDVVLIAEIIEHVAHPDDFLKQTGRLVKPGGYLILTTPNGEYFANRLPKFSECNDPAEFESVQFQPNAEGHIFLLHSNEIQRLANAAGLRVVETRFFTNPLTAGWLGLGPLLRLLPRTGVELGEKLTGSLPLGIQKKLLTCVAILLVRLQD